MKFELDDVLKNEILFYMENQDGEFLLDTQENQIINITNDNINKNPVYEDDDRFISLPSWTANDGYHLMEKFSLNLKNPVVRAELSEALNRNKGVFRAFKNILEQYPEVEKQWFSFKEQKMKNDVVLWYNALREEWGLKPVGSEPEDTSSLVLEDFVFRENKNYNFTAETADGEEAGLINSVLDNGVLSITRLEVKPEYRGMGIGKTLLSKILEKADEQKMDVSIDVPSQSDFFSRALLLENFKPCMQKFRRDNRAANNTNENE